MTKLLLLAALAVAAFGAGETLTSNCGNACVSGEAVHFTGTGYAKLKGAKDHYLVCFNHVTQIGYCSLLPKASNPVENGVISFYWSFVAGTYDVCVAFQDNGGPYNELACTTVIVQ